MSTDIFPSGKNQVTGLPFHEVAKKFGNLTGAEFDALVNDIKTNGQKVPIVMHKGMIIEGIQRYRACLSAKVEPTFTEYDGDEKDIVNFIASMNLHRRHLSTKKKKEIALELLKADPSMSDLAVAKTIRLSDKTVTKVRTDAVRRSEIPNVKVRADSKGRKQPAKKPKPEKRSKPTDPPEIAEKAAKTVECWKNAPPPPALTVLNHEHETPIPACEIDALRSFCAYTITNISSGHLKITFDTATPEGARHYQRWKELRDRVTPLIAGMNS